LNSGTLLYLIIGWALGTLATVIIHKLAKKDGYLFKLNSKAREMLLYGFILVTLIEGYLELFVISLLQVKNLSFGSFGETVSSICALSFVIVFLGMPFIMVRFLVKLVKG